MLDQGPPGQPLELLGQLAAEPLARTRRQHHRDRPHERTVPGAGERDGTRRRRRIVTRRG
jgi:hypothetical protein